MVYELSATGEYSVLHTFDGTDGDIPIVLIQDSRGNLYGITYFGGSSGCQDGFGCGVIFKITKTGDFTLLYSFTGGSDGYNPLSLTIDSAGNLYGTDYTSEFGEIFELTTSGELKVIYSFNDEDGIYPDSIVRDSKGNIYGTAFGGGTYDNGTVFKLDTNYKVTVFHSFKGPGDGDEPNNIAMDEEGNLYGLTEQGGYEKGDCHLPDSPVGCGTVFKVSNSGKFSVLFAFNGINGIYPNGLIVGPKGNVYGTSGNNVFKLEARSYKESTLYLHQSGGAQRDEISFEPEKIGNRVWLVRLDSLRVGEYGFLAPGTSSVSISASGKMYMFGVVEGDREATNGSVTQDERKAEARIGSDRPASPQEFSDASIGASTDGNPKVRHDGITLARITPGGSAEQAGIRVGDVILAVDDHYLFTAEELDTEIKHHKPGTRVAVRYRRYSTIYETDLAVGSSR